MLHGLSSSQAALRPALPGTDCHRRTLEPLLTLTQHVFVLETIARGHGEPRPLAPPGPAGTLTVRGQSLGVLQHPLVLKTQVYDEDSVRITSFSFQNVSDVGTSDFTAFI